MIIISLIVAFICLVCVLWIGQKWSNIQATEYDLSHIDKMEMYEPACTISVAGLMVSLGVLFCSVWHLFFSWTALLILVAAPFLLLAALFTAIMLFMVFGYIFMFAIPYHFASREKQQLMTSLFPATNKR